MKNQDENRQWAPHWYLGGDRQWWANRKRNKRKRNVAPKKSANVNVREWLKDEPKKENL